jgi:hypothetical protein
MYAIAHFDPCSASAARCFVVHSPADLEQGSKTLQLLRHTPCYLRPTLPKSPNTVCRPAVRLASAIINARWRRNLVLLLMRQSLSPAWHAHSTLCLG